jgi:hypothetical protein
MESLVVAEPDLSIIPGTIEVASKMAMQARDDQSPLPNKRRSFATIPIQPKGKSVVSEFMAMKIHEQVDRMEFEKKKWTVERFDREEDLQRADKKQRLEAEKETKDKMENRRFLLAQSYMLECARNGKPIDDIAEFLKKFNL